MFYLIFIYIICIIYLDVAEACLKVTITMTITIYHLKNQSNIMKNDFISIFIYSWKKINLSTEKNKCVTREINF